MTDEPLTTKAAYKPGPHFGSMVVPVAKVMSQTPASPQAVIEELKTAMVTISRSGHLSSYTLARFAEDTLRAVERMEKGTTANQTQETHP